MNVIETIIKHGRYAAANGQDIQTTDHIGRRDIAAYKPYTAT